MSSTEVYAFGTTLKRFSTVGMHPQFLSPKTRSPAHYHPKYPKCAYKKNTGSQSFSWKRQLESAEWSKYLGYRHQDLLCERAFYKTMGGPGTYDLSIKQKCQASCLKNVGFGKQKRFLPPYKDETLPPGAHTLKKLTIPSSDVPTFERDGLKARFKSEEPFYRMAPNRYSVKQKSITDKKVSKRGPYDTFTGPRDGTTIKNYFAPPSFKPPDNFFTRPSALDHLLHHPSKKNCGKFFEAIRFPDGTSIRVTKNGFCMDWRDEEFPGPAEYEVSMGIKEAKKAAVPFGSGNKNARPPPNWKIHPGPDRYHVKSPTCHKKHTKGSWMFASQAQRGEWLAVESYCNFVF